MKEPSATKEKDTVFQSVENLEKKDPVLFERTLRYAVKIPEDGVDWELQVRKMRN